MWDNSLTKTNPKAPDYQCKDSQCVDPESGYRTGVWATDTQKNAAQAIPEPQKPAQPRKLLVLDKAMEHALKAAKTLLTQEFASGGHPPIETVVNLATTMYISRTRDKVGIFKAEKEALAGAQQRAKEAAEAAERKRVEEERAQQGRDILDRGYYPDSPDDEDLPF